jgi:RES domain-containing protein
MAAAARCAAIWTGLLQAALLKRIRFNGLVYRGHHPRWAFSPLSGEGARRYGGRFNRPGVAALYTASSPEGAWREAQQGFAFKAQPLTLCAYQVDCTDIADGRSAEPDQVAAMACAWEELASRQHTVPSWDLADTLRADGFAGLIAPSFAPGRLAGQDWNLIFWDWSDGPPHHVSVIDPFGRLA